MRGTKKVKKTVSRVQPLVVGLAETDDAR